MIDVTFFRIRKKHWISLKLEKSKKTKVYLAKLAEQAERYDEMSKCMHAVACFDDELNAEESIIINNN